MDISQHSMNTLFAQLGLANSDQDIRRFIEQHRNQVGDEPIDQASFWSPNQAAFLQQALGSDSDWALLVDELNTLLHTPPH